MASVAFLKTRAGEYGFLQISFNPSSAILREFAFDPLKAKVGGKCGDAKASSLRALCGLGIEALRRQRSRWRCPTPGCGAADRCSRWRSDFEVMEKQCQGKERADVIGVVTSWSCRRRTTEGERLAEGLVRQRNAREHLGERLVAVICPGKRWASRSFHCFGGINCSPGALCAWLVLGQCTVASR